MKNNCASCVGMDVNKILRTNNIKQPKWLVKKDYVSEFINKVPIKGYSQKQTDSSITLQFSKSRHNKYILYWGAKSSSKIKVNDAKTAYGKFNNYGVAKINSRGEAILRFNCPQVYSTVEKGRTKRETFYRHIHFAFSNKNNTHWTKSVYSKIVICNVSMDNVLHLRNKGDIILINSLPSEYYAKSHIPNSFNLHYKTIKNMTSSELFSWFEEVLRLNYKKLTKNIKRNFMNIYELPIIVYCGNNKCNLSQLAIKELFKKGFVNVREFNGGMEEYEKRI